MGVADREIVSFLSLADSNKNQKTADARVRTHVGHR